MRLDIFFLQLQVGTKLSTIKNLEKLIFFVKNPDLTFFCDQMTKTSEIGQAVGYLENPVPPIAILDNKHPGKR